MANATREWIHSPRKLRSMKKALKPLYITIYKVFFNINAFFIRNAKYVPCISADSAFNQAREALMLLLNLVNFVVVPLDCAFEGMDIT